MPPEESKLLRALLTQEKQKKDRKVLHPQTKDVILRIVNFMKQEANGAFLIPAKRVQYRAAVATGFSERTIRRVVKESKSLPTVENGGEGTSVSFPPKKTPIRAKPKTGLDVLTRCEVRKMIHQIYVEEKIVPTLKKIHQKLIQSIGFKGGSRSAHKIVKELGFFWKKTKSKSYVLIERHEIRLRRIEFLRDIIKYRREGRPVLYVGEMSIMSNLSVHDKQKSTGERLVLVHAGGDKGLIPNALMIVQTTEPTGEYHKKLSNHYLHWVQEYLMPTLFPRSVIVVDSSLFLNVQGERIPTLDFNADQMKAWLRSKNILYSEDMLRPELHQIIKRHAPKYKKQKSVIEQMLSERNHTILKIPADHPDLNPIDFIWADVKQYVAARNTTFKVEDVRLLCQQRLADFNLETWLFHCERVRNVERQYLESEGFVDHEVERVMAKPSVAKAMNPCSKVQSEEANEDTEDQSNINFVRHFMGGLLGLEDYKMFNG